jgi:hypothetical protein
MGEGLTFVGFLQELGVIELEHHRSDGVVAAVVLRLPDGRRLLAVERTYRPGIKVVLEPTDDELTTVVDGDLWAVWNSDQAAYLESLAGDELVLDLPGDEEQRGR